MHAAGLESLLIFLVFIVISGLSTWLQKRRQAGEQSEWAPGEDPSRTPPRPGMPAPPPASPRRPMPAPLQDWEEELRRLLQGDRYQPPEPPPEALPPRLPAGAPPPARPIPRPSPAASAAPPPVSRRREAAVPRLEDSEQAYRRARQQQAEAAVRLREAQAKTARHQAAYAMTSHHVRSDDIRAARALLSRPNLARRVIIASVVLGQPKGLE